MIECISNRVIYYNTRTNGLHYRRVQEYARRGYILGYYGDDTDNILYKRASLVGELCSLSDNVLCIYRDEVDTDSLEVYMERNFGGIDLTGLAKYKILKTNDLFFCKDGEFVMNDEHIEVMPIGSMKEFWRKSYNITEKKHRTILNKGDKPKEE